MRKRDEYRNLIILLVCWGMIQTYFLLTTGIKTDLESEKYIFQANNLLNSGNVSSANFWFYSVQIFLIAFCMKLKIGYWGVVVIQMLLNAFATFGFYNFLISKVHLFPAFLTTLFLIFLIPFNQYTTFLQTESIFHSLLILYCVFILDLKKITFVEFIKIILFALLLMFTRPTGILLIPATVFYLTFRFGKNYKWHEKIMLLLTIFLPSTIVLDVAMHSGGELNFILPFQKEMVICGVPSNSTTIILPQDPNSLPGLLYYICNNFNQFLTLALLKTKSFFIPYRSYYSVIHNIYLISIYAIMYILTLTGIVKSFRRDMYITLFCISNIVVIWISVMITCDDWHNRFLLMVTPFLLILSALTIDNFYIKKQAPLK
jgi:hypothetical protein